MLLLNNLHDKQDVTLVAEKLIQRFSQPFDLYDVNHQTTLSLGIAYYPEHGDSVETLMQHADEALYKAKSLGKNTFNLYNT